MIILQIYLFFAKISGNDLSKVVYMQDFLILGIIPGTNITLSFDSVLLFVATLLLFVMTAIRLRANTTHRSVPATVEPKYIETPVEPIIIQPTDRTPTQAQA